jgi:hypothetical protein
MTSDFGHWLAGFFAGEGHLSVRLHQATRGTYNYTCAAGITLRADDAAVLREIASAVGTGNVTYLPDTRGNPNWRPRAVWTVGSKPGCRRLVEIFDAYPLRAKKAADFAVWREAVEEWERMRYPGPGRFNDWSRMAGYYRAIREAREYAVTSVPDCRVEDR